MQQQCKMPGCGECATTTWALVPLCENDFEKIRAESKRYFAGSQHMKYEDRTEYLKIAELIPWSQVSRGEMNPDGTVCGN